jgi:hypothetical protein
MNLAFVISLPDQPSFSYLFSVWPWPLGICAAYLFLGGCIAQPFTKWGIIAQSAGLLLFIPFPAMFPSAVPLILGPGFAIGCISACMISIGRYVEGVKFKTNSASE